MKQYIFIVSAIIIGTLIHNIVSDDDELEERHIIRPKYFASPEVKILELNLDLINNNLYRNLSYIRIINISKMNYYYKYIQVSLSTIHYIISLNNYIIFFETSSKD